MKANVFSRLFKISMTPKSNIKFNFSVKATKMCEIVLMVLKFT